MRACVPRAQLSSTRPLRAFHIFLSTGSQREEEACVARVALSLYGTHADFLLDRARRKKRLKETKTEKDAEQRTSKTGWLWCWVVATWFRRSPTDTTASAFTKPYRPHPCGWLFAPTAHLLLRCSQPFASSLDRRARRAIATATTRTTRTTRTVQAPGSRAMVPFSSAMHLDTPRQDLTKSQAVSPRAL